ncbi:META domain-containing protein [Devosia sp. YIM 151766]|uniref:META domain-containing protein n=1 Tax=Devosia sp. YIM 151766 TaxID=3017325 RepID=UPI00255CB130|nr:META domain-containing protein [Devosia sp. YIM 151766]WIY51760.1 META domain-containing protein [Devosia sp. YIM 151766]
MRIAPIVLVAMLASPAFADGVAPGTELIGTSWRLQSLAGETVADSVETTLNISADGIGGKGGCNTYGGTLQTKPGGIGFTQVFSTMMACPDPAMQQEHDWFQALEATGQYRLDGADLILSDADGAELATLRPLD